MNFIAHLSANILLQVSLSKYGVEVLNFRINSIVGGNIESVSHLVLINLN